MGLFSFLGKGLKALNPGAALLDIGAGAIKGIGANKAAKADAANQTKLGRYRRDTDQGSLTRKAKQLGVLLRMLKARPDRYGAGIADFFGEVPGRDTGYDAADFVLPDYPELRAGTSGFLAALGGGLGGAADFVGDAGRAQRDVEGRIGARLTSPGQPVYPTDASGVQLLPTRRLLR